MEFSITLTLVVAVCGSLAAMMVSDTAREMTLDISRQEQKSRE